MTTFFFNSTVASTKSDHIRRIWRATKLTRSRRNNQVPECGGCDRISWLRSPRPSWKKWFLSTGTVLKKVWSLDFKVGDYCRHSVGTWNGKSPVILTALVIFLSLRTKGTVFRPAIHSVIIQGLGTGRGKSFVDRNCAFPRKYCYDLREDQNSMDRRISCYLVIIQRVDTFCTAVFRSARF